MYNGYEIIEVYVIKNRLENYIISFLIIINLIERKSMSDLVGIYNGVPSLGLIM